MLLYDSLCSPVGEVLWLGAAMGNAASKGRDLMEKRERTYTECRRSGTLAMNLVSAVREAAKVPGKAQTEVFCPVFCVSPVCVFARFELVYSQN